MKKTMRLLLALLVLSVTACSTAPNTAGSLKSNEKQVVGLWEEYSPGASCVQYFADHTMKIYATQAESRELGGSHSMDGNWSLGDDNAMEVVISLGGKSSKIRTQMIFEKGELWVKWDDGSINKLRRIKELPAKYNW